MTDKDKNTEIPQCVQPAVTASMEFENFKDNFLFPFVFQPIERPHFDKFLEMHFKVYNMLYKKTHNVQEYAKIALDDSEVEKYGMQLKEIIEKNKNYFNEIKNEKMKLQDLKTNKNTMIKPKGLINYREMEVTQTQKGFTISNYGNKKIEGNEYLYEVNTQEDLNMLDILNEFEIEKVSKEWALEKLKNGEIQFLNNNHNVELFCFLSNAQNLYNYYYTGTDKYSREPFELPIINIKNIM